MANWINIQHYFPPPDYVFIMPCEKGVAIYSGNEMCVLEGIEVQECVDELKQFNNLLNIKEAVQVIERRKQNERRQKLLFDSGV